MDFIIPILKSKYFHAVLAIILALLIDRIVLGKLLKHSVSKLTSKDIAMKTRVKTHFGIIRTLLAVLLYFFVAVYLLQVFFNVSASSIITATGVVGIAASLGAQSFIKDSISGFFILLEDQYKIGDVVTVDSFMGTVEKITIRTTIVKNAEGDRLIIPNGNMTRIINHSQNDKSLVIPIFVSYRQDTASALALIEKTIAEVYERSELMTMPPKLLGVSAMTDFSVQISVIAYCTPENQFDARREVLREIKLAFDNNGILMPEGTKGENK